MLRKQASGGFSRNMGIQSLRQVFDNVLPLPFRKLNPNVRNTFIFAVLAKLTYCIAYSSVMNIYVTQINESSKTSGDRHKQVGISQMLVGLLALSAFPSGWLADKIGRAPVLKIAACIAFFVYSFSYFVFLTKWEFVTSNELNFVYAVQALCSFYYGVYYTPLDSIFADSISTGERSKYYTSKFVLETIASICGPAVIIGIALAGQDRKDWSKATLVEIILVGYGISALSATLLFQFSDKNILGIASQAHLDDDTKAESLLFPVGELEKGMNQVSISLIERHNRKSSEENNLSIAKQNTEKKSCVQSERNSKQERSAKVSILSENNVSSVYTDHNVYEIEDKGSLKIFKWGIKPSHVPIFLTMSTVARSMGTGMTNTFLSTFLKYECGLSIIQLQLFLISQYILTVIFANLARYFSRRIGRIQVMLICNVVTCSFLLIIAVLGYLESHHELIAGKLEVRHALWQSIWIIIPSCLRASISPACMALKHSLMMDYVPQCDRGKWSAVSGLNNLIWCFSAFCGGHIIASYGYSLVFITTASFQLICSLCLLPIIVVVAIEAKNSSQLNEKKKSIE